MTMPNIIDVYVALAKTSVDAANTTVGLTTSIVKKEEVNSTTLQMVVNSAFSLVDAGLQIPKLTNTVALGLTITKIATSDDPLADAISLGDVLDAVSAVAGFTRLGTPVGLLVTSFNVGYTIGTLLNKWVVDDLIDRLLNPTIVSKSIGTTPDPLVKTIIYVDPLVFDLDGDGLEISPISQGVIFDTNGDGIKTGTAWIGSDDGLLVLDLNANGIIDSGRELFGDETYLKNGQKAADGFAALADLDTGSLLDKVIVGANDKVFDEKDAMFSKVKIWRDLNQDGISQANELKGLLESNIKSIKLANKTVNENYGDAILTHTGTFNRTVNGEGQVGSFILAQNNFDRIFDPVTISENAASLPNILGTGMVRDLQEAATLETDLFSTVDDLYHATTREEFRRGVESLLKKWGNSSDYQSASDIAIKSGYGLILSNPYDDQERSWMDVAIKASKEERENYRSTLTTEDRNKFDAMRERMVGDLEKLYAYEAFTAYTFLNWSRITKDIFFSDYIGVAAGNQNGRPIEVLVPLSHIIRDNPVAYRSTENGYIVVNIPDAVRDISHINSLWDRLVDDAMSNLMPQFRLAKYLDLITLNINENNSISFDFSQLDERLTTEFANNSFEGTALFLDLYKVYGKDLNNMGWASRDRLVSLIEQAETNVDVKKAFDEVGYHMFSADSHYGTEESDIYTGNAQSNTFYAGAGSDVLLGKEGQDNLYGQDGDDLLAGGAGKDILDGGYGHDSYIYGHGDGQDQINNYDDNSADQDKIFFKAGVSVSDVTLVRVNDDLQIRLQNGDVLTVSYHFYDIEGQAPYAIDELVFTDGTVWDTAAIKAKVLLGGDNDDQLIGFNSADVLAGNGGNDYLNGGLGGDVLQGGVGSDTLFGGDGYDQYSPETGEFMGHITGGNDSLNGGAGQDNLYGQDGDDVLAGGAGNDTLEGGFGNDSYIYGHGDGQDQINNYDDSPTAQDKIFFKEGVSVSDVTLVRVSNDLQIHLQNGDMLTVSNHFYDIEGQAPYAIDQLIFTDGTVWDTAAIKAGVLLGGDNDEQLVGFNSADVLAGNGGNDYLNGGLGDDVLEAGIGTDTLLGGDGYDQYSPETGEFMGHITGGNDSLNGGAGNDYVNGQDGDDVLEGGTGNDTLDGGTGNDSYVYGHGEGQDIINNYNDSPTTQDKIVFKAGVLVSDVTLVRVNDDLQIRLNNSDVLSVSYYFSDIDGQALYAIDELIFTDGTVWDTAAIKAKVLLGGDNDEQLFGFNSADVLVGNGGNDYLNGGVGDDVLQGGIGNDSLFGGDGYNQYSPETGEFIATISGGNDSLNGGAGQDNLNGQDGDDVLEGGTGNDTLDGGTGNDSYIYGHGDGHDQINNYDENLIAQDKIVFKEGVLVSDVTLVRVSDDLQIRMQNGDVLTVSYHFYDVDGYALYAIDELRFADGTVWNKNEISARAVSEEFVYEYLYGDENNNILVSLDNQNSYISAGDGDDLLEGGAGKDTLDGGAGNDSYVYGHGDGQDIINNYDDSPTAQDKIVFKEGVLVSDVTLVRVYDDLQIRLNNSDVLTVSYYFSDIDGQALYAIDELRFADGTVWDTAAIKAKVLLGGDNDEQLIGFNSADVLAGNGGNDYLNGGLGDDVLEAGIGTDTLLGGEGYDQYSPETGEFMGHISGGNDSLNGGAGQDVLYGQDGDDVLEGGEGKDTLDGGAGNDSYVYGHGDGQDYINNYDDNPLDQDKIVFKADVAVSDVTLVRVGEDLQIRLQDGDILTISNHFSGIDSQAVYAIDELKFADGTVWDKAAIKAKVLLGGDNDDWLIGFNSADVLAGNGGNDYLNGGVSDDVLEGGIGNDTLDGGDGYDEYSSETGEWLGHISGGNDSLNGGAGQDVLYGQDGDDVLEGGTGNDTLNGGTGNDSYVYGHGDGQDYINSYDDSPTAQDKIVFKEGVSVSDVTLVRVSDDLQIRLQDGDILTISNHFSDIDGQAVYAIDELKFADGTVWDKAAIKAGVLLGGDNDEQLIGFNSADVLVGNGGNDYLNGGVGDDVLEGGIGNDSLWGGGGYDEYSPETGEFIGHISGGNDSLKGGAGQDYLYGQDGDDVLEGGTGNDTLDGGDGNDSYVYGHGDGQDIINNYDDSLETQDKIVLKQGVSVSDVTLVRVSDDLHIRLQNGDVLTVSSHFYDIEGRAPYAIDTLEFADGTVWDKAAIKAGVLLGGNDDDQLMGFNSADVLAGNDGNDYLNGAAGDDVLEGGTGNDSLWGGDGYEEYSPETSDWLGHVSGGNDTLKGGAGQDYLYGLEGDDVLDGGTGNDTLEGGYGNDSYVFGHGDGQDQINNYDDGLETQDKVVLKQGVSVSDVTLVRVNDDLQIRLQNGDVLTVSYHFSDIEGQAQYAIDTLEFADGTVWTRDQLSQMLSVDNVAQGTEGDDIFWGDGKPSVMRGGKGNDIYYIDDVSDVIVEFANEGNDLVNTDISLVLGDEFEDITLTGSAFSATGNKLANTIMGNSADNLLQGNESNDFLSGRAGNDTLDGGTGKDSMQGGVGDDTYIIDNPDDLVVEFNGNGFDTVRSTVTTLLSHNLEVLKLEGLLDINAIGNTSDNWIYGNQANNHLEGMLGNDYLNGDLGNDTYSVGANLGSDTIEEAHYDENGLIMGGAGGDDTVILSNINYDDVVFSRSIDANDLIISIKTTHEVLTIKNGLNKDVNWHVEHFQFSDKTVNLADIMPLVINRFGSSSDDFLYGSIGGDKIYGLAGNDTLLGSEGNDSLLGGLGSDSYLFDQSMMFGQDLIDDNEGLTTINLTGVILEQLSFTQLENDLVLIIKDSTNTISVKNFFDSNNLNYKLVLEDGTLLDKIAILQLVPNNLVITGTGGSDVLQGGIGNDIYIVNHARDVIKESINNTSIDTVQASVSYVLLAGLENLILTGTANLSGTGNSSDNSLQGNAGNNRLLAGAGNDTLEGGAGSDLLNGGTGADVMYGGLGNDTFTVENAADVVIEFVNEGYDSVNSFVSYSLTDHVERLNLENSASAINGFGNDLDNSLNGNNFANWLVGGLGNDVLQGKGGADTLEGGVGDDIYHIDNIGDVVTELANEGVDKVNSSISYTLTANVEQLYLTGIAGLKGTGNELNNIIYGNDGNNSLTGGAGNDSLNGSAGNDTLDGGLGFDTLVGGLGNDTYLLNMSSGRDTINNTDSSNGNDKLLLDTGVSADQVWLRKLGNDLEVSIIGTNNSAKIQGWYSDVSKRIDSVQLADGKVLLEAEVQNLVDAMASLTMPTTGQTSLTTAQHNALDSIILASW